MNSADDIFALTPTLMQIRTMVQLLAKQLRAASDEEFIERTAGMKVFATGAALRADELAAALRDLRAVVLERAERVSKDAPASAKADTSDGADVSQGDVWGDSDGGTDADAEVGKLEHRPRFLTPAWTPAEKVSPAQPAEKDLRHVHDNDFTRGFPRARNGDRAHGIADQERVGKRAEELDRRGLDFQGRQF